MRLAFRAWRRADIEREHFRFMASAPYRSGERIFCVNAGERVQCQK
jgi:hypothetical protein